MMSSSTCMVSDARLATIIMLPCEQLAALSPLAHHHHHHSNSSPCPRLEVLEASPFYHLHLHLHEFALYTTLKATLHLTFSSLKSQVSTLNSQLSAKSPITSVNRDTLLATRREKRLMDRSQIESGWTSLDSD